MSCYAELHGGMPRYDDQVGEGDIVATSDCATPEWRVLALRGERVWLARVDSPWIEGIVDRSRCRLLRNFELAVAA